MDEPLIQFENFGFRYNAQAEPTLYDINLSIRRGEKVLICGISGCGKSTLAHCIDGLIPFSYRGEMQGSLKICGKETRELDLFQVSRHVGTVLQDSDGQFIGLTVAEDIAFALENDCVEDPELHERVLQTAKLVDVDTRLTNSPFDLSGGQKQRVSLAGIMVNDVDIFLFDEPLANLDPATGKYAIELIDEIRNKTGAAVLIIEHRLEDVLHRDVDRIVLMSGGRIVADLPPDELLCSGLLEEHGIRACSTPKAGQKTDQPVLLEVRDLDFAYQNKDHLTLKNFSVQIREGELTAIAGKNGAGKSTFAKVLCGFEHQQKGKILFAGEDLEAASIKERADRIGYVMQNPNQMISKTMIFDEVALGLHVDLSGSDSEERPVGVQGGIHGMAIQVAVHEIGSAETVLGEGGERNQGESQEEGYLFHGFASLGVSRRCGCRKGCGGRCLRAGSPGLLSVAAISHREGSFLP